MEIHAAPVQILKLISETAHVCVKRGTESSAWLTNGITRRQRKYSLPNATHAKPFGL